MLKKSLIAAGAIAAAVIAFQPATADAGVSVSIELGVVGHGPGPGPGPDAGPGPGPRPSYRLTCRQIKRILRREHGFRDLRATDCQGSNYRFIGWRDGGRWKVKVKSRSGRVARVRPI
ncbi:MAG: hypothetical protein ACR2PM_01855 [Hyphomicrobiales bacterium]